MRTKSSYNVSHISFPQRNQELSDCCNSVLLGENDGVSGRCSHCKENCMIRVEDKDEK